MDKRAYYRALYLIAALYDFILGAVFLFFYRGIYAFTGMHLPENPVYLSMSAVFVTLLGVAFLLIYMDLEHGRKLVIYSILYKFAYTGVVLYYWIYGGIVGLNYVEMPFLVFAACDFVFALLFIESLRYIRK